MTIAIGMMCRDGIVLGADREMTLGAAFSYEQRKAHVLRRDALQIGLVGAGAEDLIRFAAQSLESRIQDRQSAAEVLDILRAVARDVDAHVRANHEFGAQSFLVGVKTDTDMTLFKMVSTAVVSVGGFEPIGVGKDMAHFVLKGLYSEPLKVTSEQGMVLVIHALKAAKDHVPGCGGRSDVLLLRRGYHVHELPEELIDEQEQNLARFASLMNPVMLALTDIEVPPPQLSKLLEEVQVNLNNFRTDSFLRRQRDRYQRIFISTTPGRVTLQGHPPAVVIRGAWPADDPQPPPPPPDEDGNDEEET